MQKAQRNDICKRSYSTEMRAQVDDDKHIITGYASVFDKKANIDGMFYEKIARGAFAGCDFKDVVLCINHDTSKIPLARSRNNNKNSTMQLSVDSKGLLISAELDVENNAEARSLYSAVGRKDMGGMSFIFQIEKETWDDIDSKMPTRTIEKISAVYEVTAATFPYYPDTTLDARAKELLESNKAALESARANARAALESARASKEKKLLQMRAKYGI